MLIQFSFKNFKSFKDDTILDLSATKITEFNDRVITIGNEKLLCAAAVFGANASGKTNLEKAFSYMTNYVLHSFRFGGDVDEANGKRDFMKPTPFLFNNVTKEEPSTFEVYFISGEEDKNRQYNYGFSVDEKGVYEEWLNSCAKSSRGNFKTIFYRNRNKNELDLSGLPKKTQENIVTSLQNEVLVVSLGAKLKVDKLRFIREWFLKHEILNFGDEITNFLLSRRIPKGFDKNPTVRKDVVKYFASFDESIVDFKVDKYIGDDEKEHLRINALHKMEGSDELASLPLQEESAGTLKMLSIYPFLYSVMESGGILFVDELNSRLHPLLVRNLLISFLDPKINKNHAQIIFTTHDSWTLSNNLLRRDEIWFTEKDKNGISNLYSLADFEDEEGQKIRKDESYEKNYLLGKYGAIPELKPIVREDE